MFSRLPDVIVATSNDQQFAKGRRHLQSIPLLRKYHSAVERNKTTLQLNLIYMYLDFLMIISCSILLLYLLRFLANSRQLLFYYWQCLSVLLV